MPAHVRETFEERLGDHVVEATTQPKGFSPGLAARLKLADGRRVFIKAVSEAANPDSHHIHRREARILAALPSSAPAARLLWTYDEGGWVALCLEDVDGRHPYEPWTERDLDLVIGCLQRMAKDLTPSPIAMTRTASNWFARTINGWQVAFERNEERLAPWIKRNLARLAELEARAPDAVGGETLLHCDVRADNILITGDKVHIVDWPWASVGAWWIDAVGMAPSVAMQGGPTGENFLRRFGVGGVSAHAIDAAICSLAGFFVVRALEPGSPGIPTLRAFQAAQGRVAVAWLRDRLSWD